MTAEGLRPAGVPSIPISRRQRLAMGTVPWRAVVWIIFPAVFWDAASLIVVGNTSSYSVGSFLVLRQMPGGMRTYGVALAALLIATVYAYGRSSTTPRDLLLRVGLASFAAWYVGWTVGILAAWTIQWHAVGVGGLGRTMAVAALCLLASWFAPHDKRG